MNKLINYTAPLLTAALFAGSAAAANDELGQDIVFGNGSIDASKYVPYVRADQGPNGTETDVLSNLREIIQRSSHSTPYVQVEGDRDNRDDLINNV